ncbi:MAG TPA: hypothetical protein VNZ86_00415, partial [Bacteroidia bacterium]|nr:hypothetical protein [Bacteroidia bacterium]
RLGFDLADKIEASFPAACPDKVYSIKECAMGSSCTVIPIYYGLGAGDDVIKEVDSGNALLGGCFVSHCNPHWFCKKHLVYF